LDDVYLLTPKTPRIAAGGIVVRGDQLLMVSHIGHDGEIFWVPPGGGSEIGEDVLECAQREVFEETGIRAKAERVLYVQEVLDAKHHQVKFWVLCTYRDGEITRDHLVPEEVDELFEARFMSRDEVARENVFPEILRSGFWEDLEKGFADVRYLGISRFC